MAIIDWLVIAIYAAAMLAVGWFYSRRNETADDYHLGGRRMNADRAREIHVVMVEQTLRFVTAVRHRAERGAEPARDPVHELAAGGGESLGAKAGAEFLQPASANAARCDLTAKISQRFRRNPAVCPDDAFDITVHFAADQIFHRRQNQSFLPKVASGSQSADSAQIRFMRKGPAIGDNPTVEEDRHQRDRIGGMRHVSFERVIEQLTQRERRRARGAQPRQPIHLLRRQHVFQEEQPKLLDVSLKTIE